MPGRHRSFVFQAETCEVVREVYNRVIHKSQKFFICCGASQSLDVPTPAVIRAHCFKLQFLAGLALRPPPHQQFEEQKFASTIESASDLEEINGVVAVLLNLYYQQLSATIDIVEGNIS